MIALRPYQAKAVNEIRAAFRNKHRAVLFVLPTGGGKTFTFSFVADGAAKKGNKTLILVHRKELLMQASMSLAKIGLRHCVIAQSKHVYEIQHQHMTEFRRSFVDQSARVAVASVGTLVNRLSATWSPDLIIPDEAHHCTQDNTWGKILGFYDNSAVLGVTATPIRSDGKGLGVDFGGIFNYMVQGPTMSDLIGMRFLLPSTVYAPPTALDLTGVRRGGGDFNQKQLNEAVDKPVITGSAVEHYRKICPGTPGIAFCVSVSHAEHVAAQFRAAGWRAQSIDGSMLDTKRRSLIDGLSTGRLDLLTSCDIVSEGTDIPVVGCGILLRPTQSTGLYIQQVGRILRPYEGQERAFILDHVGNCQRHGLPEEDREWSLDGTVKRKGKGAGAKSGPSVMQCEKCYVSFPPAPCCPNCGTAVETSGRTVKEVEGELAEVTEDMAKAMKRQRGYEMSQADTLEKLVELGKQKGYKNPYAWGRHIMRGRAMQGKKA